METVAGTGWGRTLHELLRTKGTAIILGGTDSGKSTLARYLSEGLVAKGEKVCLVDADVGQSTLGLPGTISMKLFKSANDLRTYRFRKMFFAGDVNPSKRIPLMIRGTRKMAALCRKDPAVTLVDTTGLISGKAGEALKTGKIRAIGPDHIIALQREGELEALLDRFPEIRIHRLGVSVKARVRTAPERTAYRRKKLHDYFSNPAVSEFLLLEREAKFTRRGKRCELRSGLFPEGTVIGLNQEGETLALGVVTEVENHAVIFRSPLSSLSGVDGVEFGDMFLPGPTEEKRN
jgi:polynucleotide 5'-hydroxyl-kinase GRC3/NOL9